MRASAVSSAVLWQGRQVTMTRVNPQIMAGLNQTIMLSLSMVVIAALVGAPGLGVPVVRALNSVNTALGFESGFIIVVVAILLVVLSVRNAVLGTMAVLRDGLPPPRPWLL